MMPEEYDECILNYYGSMLVLFLKRTAKACIISKHRLVYCKAARCNEEYLSSVTVISLLVTRIGGKRTA